MAKSSSYIDRNSVFGHLGLAICVVLLAPLLAMQSSEEVSWTLTDFVMAGTLLFVAGSVFILLARRFPGKKLLIATATLLVVLYLWAEMAVGLLTNIGS